uniref:PHD-type domain-containing protein n=1 Tax=Knipowitschia caucasica TaxID=637954 RepID=A0AAV2M9W8_KNICA
MFCQDLLTRVEDFEQRSERLLSDEAPRPADLQELLDLSLGLDVELPQRPELRERLEQARWLEAVTQESAQPDALCLDTMRRLIDQGVGLAPHGSVEKAMARLQELLTVSEQWEERALGLMENRPFQSLEDLDAVLQEVDNIPAFLPNCLELKDVVERGKSWTEEAEALQLGGRIPVLESLLELVHRADSISVKLEPLSRLEALVGDVQTWKESAAKTFLLNDSNYSLLEVLCPRCDVGPALLRSRCKKGKEASPLSRRSPSRLDSVCDVEKALSESKDSASAMDTLAEVQRSEMELLLALRTSNDSRILSAEACSSLGVCVCQRPPSGAMVRCELCRELFHCDCVRPEQQQAWFCPLCQRSRKPPLDKVLPLLASLQRIRVRLPEGDALRFLIERTVRWQHKVQQACADGLLERLGKSRGRQPLPSRTDWERHGASFYMEHASFPVHALPSELDELLVEGFLLQVTLPETEQLHRYLLYKLTPPPAPSPRHSPEREQRRHKSGKTRGSSPSKENCQSKRTKRRKDSSDSQLHEKAKKSRKKKSKRSKERREERRKERREEARLERREEARLERREEARLERREEARLERREEARLERREEARLERREEARLERREEARLERREEARLERREESREQSRRSSCSPPHTSDPAESESEEDFSLCAAAWCREPEGDEVNWVQCDGSCNQWFHQVCVGLSAERAETEDYVCISCTQPDYDRDK